MRVAIGLLTLIGGVVFATLPSLHLATAPVSLGVVQSFGGANTRLTGSLSVSPGSPTTGGDLLVATIKNRDLQEFETVTSVVDSSGNTWTSATQLNEGQQADEEIWFAADTAPIGTNGTVTVTLSGAAAIAVTVLEIAGASSTPLDDVASEGDVSANASTGTADASAQDIVVADVGWNADVTPINSDSGVRHDTGRAVDGQRQHDRRAGSLDDRRRQRQSELCGGAQRRSGVDGDDRDLRRRAGHATHPDAVSDRDRNADIDTNCHTVTDDELLPTPTATPTPTPTPTPTITPTPAPRT